MTVRHELPNDAGWVELRERHEVREVDRRRVRVQLLRLSADARQLLEQGGTDNMETLLSADDVEAMFVVNDACAVGVIVAASFLPPGAACTIADVQNLPGPIYDEVLKLAAPYVGAFMGVDFDDPTPGDRNSPT